MSFDRTFTIQKYITTTPSSTLRIIPLTFELRGGRSVDRVKYHVIFYTSVTFPRATSFLSTSLNFTMVLKRCYWRGQVYIYIYGIIESVKSRFEKGSRY